MKAAQFLSLIFITAFLMGCQIEVTPIGEEQISGTSNTATTDLVSNEDRDTGSSDEDSVPTEPEEITSVTLYWSAPVERVNGEAMSGTEIGGYEIRYKKETDSSYTNIVINDASIDQYAIDNLEDIESYVFEVAVFDSDGIYSDFVTALES